MYDGDISLSVDLKPGDVKAAAQSLQSEIESIFNNSAGEATSSAFMRLKINMDKSHQSATKLIQQMNALESSKVPTTEYTVLETELSKIDAKFTALNEKRRAMERSGNTNTSAYKNLEVSLDTLNKRAEEVRKKMSEMEKAGTSHVAGTQSAEYERLSDSLKQTSDRMATLRQQYSEMRDAGNDIQTSIGPLSRFGKLASYISQGPLGILKSVLASIGNIALSAFNRLVSAIKSAIKKVWDLINPLNLLKKAAQGLFTVFKTLTKTMVKIGTSFSLAGRLASRFSSGLKGVGSSATSSGISLKKAAKFLVRYGLGMRSLFTLFRKLRSAAIDGFKNVTQYSSDMNYTVSNLVSSLNYLKNSVGAAFAPLVSVVGPILTQFINKVASAANAVGQLFSALTGKQTYIQAKNIYQDYAKSLDKTSSAGSDATKQTKKLNKQAKELKRTIAGFDDVEILQGPDKDTDPDSNSGGKASNYDPSLDPKNMFETKPIENKFKDLVDKLKKMWRDADFTELGRILGEKLRDALNNIPWDKIKEVLRKIAKSIATFLNGFLETPGLFDAIGRTLAQALNSAFEFLNEFAKNFHFDSLGYAIRDGILGALNNLDWPLIYETCARWGRGIGTTINAALENPDIWIRIFDSIARAFNALLIRINAFVSKVHWGSIAYYIANGMNHGMDTFNWGLLGDTLVKVLNGAFDFLYKWLSTFNFYKFGSYIGQTISKVLKETDWTTFGAMLGAFVDGLLDLLRGIFDQVEWKDLAKAVTDTINGFFSEFDWDEHKDTLDLVGTGLFRVLGIIFDMIPWGKIANKIIDTIKETLYKVDWFKVLLGCLKLIVNALIVSIDVSYGLIFDAAGDIIKGLLKGITAALTGIGDWVYKNIFKPIFNAIKKAFGISSPAKEMEPIGVNIVEGLKKGITSVIDSVREKADNIKDKIKGVFNKEKWETLGTNLLDKIKNGVGNNSKIQTILSSVNSITTSMKNKFGEVNWTTLGENLAQGIGNGIANKLEFLKTTAWNLAVNMYNKACEALGIHSPSTVFRDKVGKMITAGLAEGVEDSADKALNAVASLSDAIVDTAATDLKIPAVVSGEIVPYSFGKTNTSDTNNTLNKLMEMLQYNQDRTITRDELMAMLIDLFTRYLNIDFYIGDEQIARHANAGNQRLDRRYKPASI